MKSRRHLLQHTLTLPWVPSLSPTLSNSLIFPGLASLAGPTHGTVVQSTPGRTALVIGNQRYKQNPLRSSANDARAVAGLLTQAGFSVELKLDASLRQMTQAIDSFSASVAARDVGTSVFYYAGHAAQLDWRNFLLPVDGDVESAGDVRAQCVDLGYLLSRLGRTRGKTALIILDACRDDPFGSRFRPPLKGMSQYDAPPDTLLAFATSPGKVAVEPRGSDHGLYTEHLVRELAVKGVQVEDALKRVRLNVRLASRGRQIPWESTSLERALYLFPAPTLSEADLERQFRDELQQWSRIKNSTQLADWTAYLRQFPNGKFAEAAQVRMRGLLARAEAADPLPGKERSKPLQLGSGLPVPTRLKGSGNPNSAGTYPFRLVWTPGDYYVFQELDLHSRVVQRTYRINIKKVDPARDRVATGDGSLLTLMGASLLDGNRREYDVPIEVNPTELQVGRKWTSRYRQLGPAGGDGEYEFKVVTRELVTVPAGEFSAFRIDGEGWFGGPSTRNRRTLLSRWVVPGVNFAVKQEWRHLALARELVAARQAVLR